MKYIQAFEKYGCKEYENGTKLYGHAPFIAPKAYNFRIFSPVSEQEIVKLEQDMHREIPYCISFVSNEKCQWLESF